MELKVLVTITFWGYFLLGYAGEIALRAIFACFARTCCAKLRAIRRFCAQLRSLIASFCAQLRSLVVRNKEKLYN